MQVCEMYMEFMLSFFLKMVGIGMYFIGQESTHAMGSFDHLPILIFINFPTYGYV